MSTVETLPEEQEILSAERVAGVVAGIGFIGHARDILEMEGWTAVICANKITVNNEVIATYASSNGHTWWECHRIDGTPPVWTVGAEGSEANWAGAS